MGADGHEVVVAGGGPTGLMLAAELALAGIDVVIVERRESQTLESARAGGLHIRSLEVLDQRGVAERFVEAGQPFPAIGFGMIRLSAADFPTRFPFVLSLWQNRIERILADWVLGELRVPIRRSTEVLGFTRDADGVDVAVPGARDLVRPDQRPVNSGSRFSRNARTASS